MAGVGTASTVEDAARALRAGETSSVELTEAALRRADEQDGVLGVYLARFDEPARAAARRADDELSRGLDRGLLHGIPVGVKDILASAEGPTTAQSLVLDRAWGDGRDAPVVSRLRAAGAVVVGKTTTMEFAVGMPDPEKPFVVPRNPWDLGCWPGGSSSGTGAGVAAGFFLAGIGTDTGGSIRIPAALCGVTGLMPTYGRVPKSGCVPLGYSLDHIGPLARSARDCGLMLQVLAGFDPTDPTSSRRDVDQYVDQYVAEPGNLKGLRLGVVGDAGFFDGGDPAARRLFDEAVAGLCAAGADATDVSLPYYGETLAATMLTIGAEALAYHHVDMQSRWGDYGRSTRLTIAGGAMATAADYVQAQRVRRLGQRALRRVFDDVDVIVTPTLSMGAPRYGAGLEVSMGELMARCHTVYWDGVGNPVLALPMGFTAEGLPLSLQVAARPFEEATLVRVGGAFQARTDWHLRQPPDPRMSAKLPDVDATAPGAPAGAAPPEAPAGGGTDEVTRVLAHAGLQPPPGDYPALAGLLAHQQEFARVVRGVAAARYEEPALMFQAEAAPDTWGGA